MPKIGFGKIQADECFLQLFVILLRFISSSHLSI